MACLPTIIFQGRAVKFRGCTFLHIYRTCQPTVVEKYACRLGSFPPSMRENRTYFETTTQLYFCKAYRPLATRSSKPTLKSGSKLCLRWRRDDHRLTLKNAAENIQLFKSKSGKQCKHLGHSYTLINFDSTKRNCARTASTSRELCFENCTPSIGALLGPHGKRLWPNKVTSPTKNSSSGGHMLGSIKASSWFDLKGTFTYTPRKTNMEPAKKHWKRRHLFEIIIFSFSRKVSKQDIQIIISPATTTPVQIRISIYIMHHPESQPHTEIKQCIYKYIMSYTTMHITYTDMSLPSISHLPISSIVFRIFFLQVNGNIFRCSGWSTGDWDSSGWHMKGRHWKQAKNHGIVDGSEIRLTSWGW